MNKLTNLIGSFIVAIIAIAFPVITGIGMASDWLERESVEGALIHPWLAILWILCLICTIGEIAILTIVINNSEVI